MDESKKLIDLAEHIKKEYEDGKVDPLPEGTNTEGVIKILDEMMKIIKTEK